MGIVVGNPLDIIKVRQQAGGHTVSTTPAPSSALFQSKTALVTGTAAPILGYGALNALLFVSYNRTETFLNKTLSLHSSLWTIWLAGAVGGLATWIVSCPTELVKCRAQMAAPPRSSWAIARDVWRADGIRGLYFGGLVTAFRDSIGYGFYFWSYKLMTSRWPVSSHDGVASLHYEAPKILFCGGIAGIVTWASVFPLDMVKTRVQTQPWDPAPEASALLPGRRQKRAGALQITRQVFRQEGVSPFFRGLTVCSARAFIVNAVQWAMYEWVMHELGQGRKHREASVG